MADIQVPINAATTTSAGVMTAAQVTRLESAATATELANYYPRTGGSIAGSIIPSVNDQYELGSTSYEWASIYTNALRATGTLTVNGTAFINGNNGLSVTAGAYIGTNLSVGISASGVLSVYNSAYRITGDTNGMLIANTSTLASVPYNVTISSTSGDVSIVSTNNSLTVGQSTGIIGTTNIAQFNQIGTSAYIGFNSQGTAAIVGVGTASIVGGTTTTVGSAASTTTNVLASTVNIGSQQSSQLTYIYGGTTYGIIQFRVGPVATGTSMRLGTNYITETADTVTLTTGADSSNIMTNALVLDASDNSASLYSPTIQIGADNLYYPTNTINVLGNILTTTTPTHVYISTDGSSLQRMTLAAFQNVISAGSSSGMVSATPTYSSDSITITFE